VCSSCRLSHRHRRQAAASDSQYRFHVAGTRQLRQLRLLRVTNAEFGIRGLGGGGPVRLDTIALRVGVHDRTRPRHIANFLATDWRTVPPGVSRPRLQHQHELQLLLRVLWHQALYGLSAGELLLSTTESRELEITCTSKQ